MRVQGAGCACRGAGRACGFTRPNGLGGGATSYREARPRGSRHDEVERLCESEYRKPQGGARGSKKAKREFWPVCYDTTFDA